MSEHVRDLLALGAAGVLSPENQRSVDEHVSVCAECAGELKAWQTYTAALGRLPSPRAPADLVRRTQARVLAEMVAHADRRWDDAVLTMLALYAWTLGLAGWAIFRVFSGGWMAVLETNFLESLVWLAASTVLAWVTAAVAAVALSRQRRLVRRSL